MQHDAACEHLRDAAATLTAMLSQIGASPQKTMRLPSGATLSARKKFDALLRGQACDPASVESYSIKRLELRYGFARDAAHPDPDTALSRMQARLELGDTAGINAGDQGVFAGYNKDDCISTLTLRDWLEAVDLEHRTIDIK